VTNGDAAAFSVLDSVRTADSQPLFVAAMICRVALESQSAVGYQ